MYGPGECTGLGFGLLFSVVWDLVVVWFLCVCGCVGPRLCV